MNKKLVIVQKTRVSSFPPLMAAIEGLSRENVEIILICGNELVGNMPFLQKFCHQIHILDIPDGKSMVGKLWAWTRFRYKVWKLIGKENLSRYTFYFPTADTVLALGQRIKSLHYILNLYELYDQLPMYLRNLKQYAVRASMITCPDYTRAHIFKVWWKLRETPTVIPNRPLERPNIIEDLPQEIQYVLSRIEGKKIIHYQGLISRDRDLFPICHAINELPDFALVLMGRDFNYLKDLLNICDRIIYIPFMIPPKHLLVTKMARIGLLSYDHSSLNNIFCAPNKIWEYSSLGIPILGNDIPGLKNVIEPAKMGRCADYSNIEEIKKMILEIDENYNAFSKNSYNYFDSICMDDIYDSIIQHIR